MKTVFDVQFYFTVFDVIYFSVMFLDCRMLASSNTIRFIRFFFLLGFTRRIFILFCFVGKSSGFSLGYLNNQYFVKNKRISYYYFIFIFLFFLSFSAKTRNIWWANCVQKGNVMLNLLDGKLGETFAGNLRN